MADRNDPAERLATLEQQMERAEAEVSSLRIWRHDKVAAILQTVLADDAGIRLRDLEGFKNRLIGIALGLGFVSGVIGGLIVKAWH